MLKFKLYLALTFILLLANQGYSQQTVMTIDEFSKLSLNDKISIRTLESVKDYQSKLIELFGQAQNSDCVNDMFGKSCELIYSGFSLSFANNDELFDLTLKDPTAYLSYGDLTD